MAPLPQTALKGIGTPEVFMAIDPGQRCGVCLWSVAAGWRTSTTVLDELPGLLDAMLRSWGPGCPPRPAFVVIENYSLTGGNRRNDPSMPSSRGIGMAHLACAWTDTPLFLIQRGSKRAGHMALDQVGQLAFQAARNLHERDVVDLAGFALREMRLPS